LTRSPSVELLGEQAPPRVLYEPSARANSWEDVADLSASLGLILDPWQETVLRASMGERSDGRWAAHQVGVSAPRQNGKSQIIVARAVAGALLFGEKKIVISAHQQDTARETFGKFLEQIDNSPALAARIAPNGIMNAINREQIKFTNGAIIKFKARSGAGGQGFSSDCLFLDEAQILGPRAWASINSTMSAMPNPQVWLMGTPPTPEDDGVVFTKVRESALKKKATSLAWLEWAADPTDDPALEETRAKANPAWHTRINHDVVQGEFETYSVDQFALERLGIWMTEKLGQAINQIAWKALGTEAPAQDGTVSYGVKFSPDGASVALAVALKHDRGVHVELVAHRPMSEGTAWLTSWLKARHSQAAQIVVDGKSGAGGLVASLLEGEVRVPKRVIITPTTDQVVSAHSLIAEGILAATLSHFADPVLDGQVEKAGRRDIGTTGGWGWKPLRDGDVTGLEAVTMAHWAAKTSKRRPGRKTSGRVMA